MSVLVVILTACSPATSSTNVIQTAIAQTRAAQPTNTILPPTQTFTPTPTLTNTPQPTSTSTSTLIPLSEINLEPLLIQQGDLPSGFSGAQVSDLPPKMFQGMPKAANKIDQRFQKEGEAAGGVAVFLYETGADIEKAYSYLLEGMGENLETVQNIGDAAQLTYSKLTLFTFGDNDGGDLAFKRCSGVIHIRMVNNVIKENLISYATRLDKRLSLVICR